MRLELYNNLTKVLVNIKNLEDLKDSNLFYHFKVRLPEKMDDGEYEYRLIDGETVLNIGLLQIGDHVAVKNEYKTENNGFITYNG